MYIYIFYIILKMKITYTMIKIMLTEAWSDCTKEIQLYNNFHKDRIIVKI